MTNPFTDRLPLTESDLKDGECEHGTLLAHGTCAFCERDALRGELVSIKSGVKCSHDAAYYNAGADNFYCIHCKAGMGDAFYEVAKDNMKLQADNDALRKILSADDTGKVLLTKEQQRDSAIEVLKYAASLCESKNLSFKNTSYRAACDDIKVCLLASIERLESGERMEAAATVCSDGTGKVLLTKEQHEELLRDKARLDWVEKQEKRQAEEHQSISRIDYLIWYPWMDIARGDSLRAAIDAAIRADAKGTKP
jgi:hypothetical protein